MAAGDIYIFAGFHEKLADGTITMDLDSTTVKLALFRASLTAAIGAGLSYYGSATAQEVTASSGAAYPTAGVALTTASVTTSSSFIYYRASNVTFAQDASGFTNARWGLLYLEKSTPGTSPVMGLLDLGSAQSNVSAALNINWATGRKILKISGTAMPAL